jgi:signal transduction histidine kinase
MQASLLLLFGATLLLLVAVLAQGGPVPENPSGRVKRSLLWAVVGALAILLWPRDLVGLPLAPSILFFLLAVLLAGTHERWRAWLAGASPGQRAIAVVLGVALLSLLLHPTLVHFGEKALRHRIEGRYAEVIRTQSFWRSDRLRQAQAEVDLLNVLEESPPRRPRPGEEELAFWIWSSTGLRGAGVASAVEVQDRSGAVISRFALDMPALLATVPSRGLPRENAWTASRDELQVASAERHVLHARRRLVYHGEVHGAVHLYLGDDAWDLPFLPRRDPMSALYRSAPEGPAREESLDLAVFAAPSRILFASAERPPALTPALLQRLEGSPEGLWTTLPVDGRRQHTYLLTQGAAVYAISYPRLSVGTFLAGLAEAVACLGGITLLVILALMLVRTALGRKSLSLPSLVTAVRERFALRLFVSFAAAAVLPVAFLEFAFRGYVAERLRRESEDQALERAAVAQRAVDDFSFYQRGEGPDRAAVTDSALVWVSRLIRGDLDVFRGGQLLASSKRELFSSGLLPSTVPGPVFRALTLEGSPSLLRTERIGGFSALVAYVPVRLDGLEPGILALPLAVKEREVQATLEDFDRSMRLATLAFLALAGGLALPLSRAISGPLRDLTRATRRVARGDLKARVETGNRDEIKDLVDSFNQMAGDLDRQRTDLERSNRLAAWAEMARQVAHEVKNPLTPIQLSAEHLQRVWRDGAPDFGATLAACTDTILRQVRSLRGIVTEFSAFARPPAPEPESVDPGRLVADAVRPYQSALPAAVRLDLEVEAGLPRLRLDRRLVARAVVNLVENALHAVGEAGLITVRVRGAREGAVAIEVEDDGPGLSPEALARAFEPFFSTKSDGSGLGLALVRRVTEDHGGSVTLSGPPGGPTVATLVFPNPIPTGAPLAHRAPAHDADEETTAIGGRK